MTARASGRLGTLGALGCVVAVLLTGCASGSVSADPAAGDRLSDSGSDLRTDPPGNGADDESMGAGESAATAPDDLGLPTTEAPGPGDDGDSAVEETHGPPKTVVPERALLDAATVAAVTGGTWVAGGEPERCAAPAPGSALAVRSSVLDSPSGRLVQTVATHRSPDAAVAAVPRLVHRLTACGWERGEDLMLGEAGAGLTRSTSHGRETAAVLAVEGVSLTLVGSGSAATADAWAGLADLALGSSCPAAPDGCH